MSRVSTSSLHAPLFSFPSPHHPLYLLLPSIPLRFPPRLASSLRRQPEISEFVWNSLPVLLGAIEADRPSTTTDGRRQRSGRSWDARPRRSERADEQNASGSCHGAIPLRAPSSAPPSASAPSPCVAPLRRSSPRPRFSRTPASMQTLLSARRRFATRPLTLRVNHLHVRTKSMKFSMRNYFSLSSHHRCAVVMRLVDKLLFHLPSTKLLLSALFVARSLAFVPSDATRSYNALKDDD